MLPTFTCQGCLKFLGPERNLYEEVYRDQPLCMMCRKAAGQHDFSSIESEALFAEETLAALQERDA
jgi:hypothetical protein